LKAILTAVATWLLVGVPVAVGISFLALPVFIIEAVPGMATTAVILGAIHGVWVLLAHESPPFTVRQSPEVQHGRFEWFGVISGGSLGLLGFLPVFSRTTSIETGYVEIIIFLAAAACAGVTAGVVFCGISSRKLLGPPVRRQSLIVGSLLVLALAAIEYAVYWDVTADRLPLLKFQVANLPAGDATGTAWSDCYDYIGIASDGSGKVGGRLLVRQQGGRLEVTVDGGQPLRGGIDREGRFRAGAEQALNGMTVRTLWEGKFGSGLIFRERTTSVFDGLFDGRVNILAFRGVAERRSCHI
jgi:hypothetical protein